MMHKDKIELELKQATSEYEEMLHKSKIISFFRFAIFLVMIYGIYIGYDKQQGIGYIILFVMFILFICLYVYHQKVKKRILFIHCLKEVYESLILRIDQGWSEFKEDGSEFEVNALCSDLDLIGHASLYQYISCVATPFGKRKLYESITNQHHEIDRFRKDQAAVKELLDKANFNINLQAYCVKMRTHKMMKDDKMEEMLTTLEHPIKQTSTIFNVLRIVLPIGMLVLFIATVLFDLSYIFLWCGFLIQFVISVLYKMKSDESLSTLFMLSKSLEGYEDFFMMMSNESFESVELSRIHDLLKKGKSGIHQLQSLIGFVNVRLSPIAYFFFSGLFLVDLHLVHFYSKWCKQYGNQVREWMESIGSLESYLSLSNIGLMKEEYIFPQVMDCDTPLLKMEGLRHPLMKESKCVVNDLDLNHGTCIITGSNMSGKTTFMRSVGVNLILAMAGAPVCASRFDFTLMEIYTSMRVKDDVEHGISTFYGEILRIKEMMEASKKKHKMLVLIDEIFKGTNSADRIIGAKEAIRRLHEPWILSFVTTHDFELCALGDEYETGLINMHFAEYYEQNEIHFDYKIKEGRCQSTNAIALMKMAGII